VCVLEREWLGLTRAVCGSGQVDEVIERLEALRKEYDGDEDGLSDD
jgi:hypothetical protein